MGRLQIWAATQFGHLWWTEQDHSSGWRRFENAESEADAGVWPLVDFAVARSGTFRTPVRVAVDARTKWVDTGVDVIKGEPWSVYATGIWSNSGSPNVGPEGFVEYGYPGTLFHSAPLASLVGKISSGELTNYYLAIGPELQGVVPVSGRLFLSINDTDTFEDNQGSMSVLVH